MELRALYHRGKFTLEKFENLYKKRKYFWRYNSYLLTITLQIHTNMLDVVKTKIANCEEKRNFVEQHSCDFKKTN